jgi:hypothetical protein
MSANPHRGEVALVLDGTPLVLRPTYARLVAAEAELGPLFALVERTTAGQLTLAELTGLLWHCLDEPMPRELFGERLLDAGLAHATPALRAVLEQVLGGQRA